MKTRNMINSILILILVCVLSGCTNYNYDEIKVMKLRAYNLVCIDGIEYIRIDGGYQGYMAPHLKADENDYPKVMRCTNEN